METIGCRKCLEYKAHYFELETGFGATKGI